MKPIDPRKPASKLGPAASLASVAFWLLLGLALTWALAAPPGRSLRAQAPTATPTMVPVPPPAAIPDLSGEWSVTRSWYRGCPGCSMPVTLSSTWVISQTGTALRMEQGPAGALVPDGVGGYRLQLEGLEQSGPLTLRFFYAGLRISADDRTLEGGFSGSERLQNPCGDRPVLVTCFANAGWLRATRLGGGGSQATVVAPPATAAPSSTPTTPPTSTPTEAPSATPTGSPTATVSPSVTASPTPRPPLLYLPRVWR